MALHEREALLSALGDALAGARRRPGRLVLVCGEAGIGKTALVEAFAARAAGSASVLSGTCDAVLPPRPFAPVADIADVAGGPLRDALDAADRDRVFEAFLALLRRPRRAPAVVVLEDVHWADDATLDLLRVVGRRLRELPVLVVATYREEEVPAVHPLRRALGDVPATCLLELHVPPLSPEAVAALARATALDARELHHSTGGNAFFVTEVVAARTDAVPASVRDAVLARASRLSDPARGALRVASVLGRRCRPSLLGAVARVPDEALHECVDRGMLELDGEEVRFRHELAQRAIHATLAPRERAALHAQALEALAADGADPAILTRHAVEAGDADAAHRSARAAGDRAASLGAHAEAAAQYATALRFADGVDAPAHASLLEAHARESLLVDDAVAALASQEAALERRRRLGDAVAEGDCLRALSQILWFAGMPRRAVETAGLAVELLERVAPGRPELARAYAALAQRHVVAGDDAAALPLAEQAHALAASAGDEQTAVHALTTAGIARVYLEGDGWHALEESVSRALAAGLDDDAARAYINLVELARDTRRYAFADRHADDALRFLAERDHDLEFFHRRLLSDLADLALDRGDWERARELAAGLLAGPTAGAAIVRVRALTVEGRLLARRGDETPWVPLDEALVLAVRQGEPQELCPVSYARAEAAWLDDDLRRARTEAERGLAAARRTTDPWWLGEGALWLRRSGADVPVPRTAAEPYRLHLEGRYGDAAAAWRDLGCPYHEAAALADSPRESDLRAALTLFRSLGADAPARRAASRLRALGARAIPRGPRRTTRANPGGLTTRELEVLALLREGLRNAEIAGRLVLSPKTVDHHVSAILRKLGVPDRAAAAAKASELGLQR